MLQDWMNSLYEIADTVARGETMDETLALAVKLATVVVHCDECSTYVRQGDELVPWVWKYVEHSSLDRKPVPVSCGFAAAIAKSISILAADNPHQPLSFRKFNEWSNDPGETFVCVPFLSRDQLLGAMTLHHWRPRVYSLRDLKFLYTAAYTIGSELGIASAQKQYADLLLELETRKLIERSKGILQRDHGMSEHDAYLALQNQSHQKKRPLKEIAQAIILNAQVRESVMEAD